MELISVGYLAWRPCRRLVLVVGEDEERQCAQLRMLQSRVELVAGGLEVLIRRGAVQHEDDALRPLVVTTPILLDVVRSCRQIGRYRRHAENDMTNDTKSHNYQFVNRLSPRQENMSI